ncbi:MAG: dienelactone hydrolase family protein [Gemmataceae bacterium]
MVASLLLVLTGCGGRTVPVESPEAPAWRTVALPTAGQGEGVARLYPAVGGTGRHPAVVAVHGDFGLTDAIDANARRLARLGYVVLTVDLYRGEKVDSLLDAHILDRGLPEERTRADLLAAVDFLARQTDVDPDAIGVIGWDMGGGYALDAAVRDARLRAAVNCYGRLTTDANLLRPLRAAVLVVSAGKDEGNPSETREAFRKAMRAASKRLVGPHVFDTAEHGFLNPPPHTETPAPDPATVEQAWQVIERFLAAELPRGGPPP